jgi:hypothetical protein
MIEPFYRFVKGQGWVPSLTHEPFILTPEMVKGMEWRNYNFEVEGATEHYDYPVMLLEPPWEIIPKVKADFRIGDVLPFDEMVKVIVGEHNHAYWDCVTINRRSDSDFQELRSTIYKGAVIFGTARRA